MMKRDEWVRYQPFRKADREGWKMRVGNLTICVYQMFRFLADGTPKWTGCIEGCTASVDLLCGSNPRTADEAKERALAEVKEIIKEGTQFQSRDREGAGGGDE